MLHDTPFVDYAGFSFPASASDLFIEDVSGHAVLAGGVYTHDDSVAIGPTKLCYWGRRNGVHWLRLTGSGLDALRRVDALGKVVGCIGFHEHRVTQLHIALDVVEHASRRLSALQRRVRASRLFLTRKSVGWFNTVKGPCPITGAMTGTLYLGRRTSDVWAKVYDKRAERINKGFDDPGPLTRYELSLGRHTDISLGDLVNPAPAFWHHMGRPAGVLTPPQQVPEWAPLGSGYHLPPREPPDALARVLHLLDSSADLFRIHGLLRSMPAASQRLAWRKIENRLAPVETSSR